MADDASELDQLEDRFSGVDADNAGTEQTDNQPQQADGQQTLSGEDTDVEEPDWEPLTVYLLEDQHEEFSKPFFMELRIRHRDEGLMDYEKRVLQQAAVEVSMDYPDEVAERSVKLNDELNGTEEEEDGWKPLTVYLTDDKHADFNKAFFYSLRLENQAEGLMDYQKRVLQQAAIEVSMENPEKVVEKAHEVRRRLTGE